MTKNQYEALIKYIDAASSHAAEKGPEWHHTESFKHKFLKRKAEEKLRKELLNIEDDIEGAIVEDAGKDYIIKSLGEERDMCLGLLEVTSTILNKESGESISDAAKRIMEERAKYIAFFEKLLDTEQYGWSVNEEVRDEARTFLGIPKVKAKKK